MVVGRSELPYTLSSIRAESTDGADVTSTATAVAVDGHGVRSRLYGDGSSLQLRAERFAAGRYSLHVTVRDRNGRSATARVALTIEP